jgi:hypothetical protein
MLERHAYCYGNHSLSGLTNQIELQQTTAPKRVWPGVIVQVALNFSGTILLPLECCKAVSRQQTALNGADGLIS